METETLPDNVASSTSPVQLTMQTSFPPSPMNIDSIPRALPLTDTGSIPTMASDADEVDVDAKPVRRASITFKLKSYNATADNAPVRHAPSAFLDPHWPSGRTSRAASPALSIQSESSDRPGSIKGNGTRPATFLYTLTSFLRDNPNSPYMRWSEDGTYFVVPDKAGLLDVVISKLFNQNSYSSFARQLNIYGWRRLQTSPDGKTTSASCTIWKHDQITKHTPDDDLKTVKRNAQDKTRRNSRGDEDDIEEYQYTKRTRRALTVSSTTAAEAMALRTGVKSVQLRESTATFPEQTRRSRLNNTGASPPDMPSVLAPTPSIGRPTYSRSVSAVSVGPTQAVEATRVVRPMPGRSVGIVNTTRRPIPRSISYTNLPTSTSHVDSPSSTTDTESTTVSTGTAETDSDASLLRLRHHPDDIAVSVLSANARSASPSSFAPTEKRQKVDHRAEVERPIVPVHRRFPSHEKGLGVLPFQLAARRQILPQNPVDVRTAPAPTAGAKLILVLRHNDTLQVYVACVDDANPGVPVVKGRDRLDLPIWVDDFSQARFVLAGEMMRAWVLWEVVPETTFLYIASVDPNKPPRPLGIAENLKRNIINADPNHAYSRERIYLETGTEAGCVGQCCIIFRNDVSGQDNSELSVSSNTLSHDVGRLERNNLPSPMTPAPLIPPTPKIQCHAAMSSERHALWPETESGRRFQDHPFDSPGSPLPVLKTPRTADAVSSLAAMQAFGRVPSPPAGQSTSIPMSDMEDSKPIQEGVLGASQLVQSPVEEKSAFEDAKEREPKEKLIVNI